MTSSPESPSRPALALTPLLILAAVRILAHLLTNGNYGMFRDEFYYLACADHLDWGYVDHPPLSLVLLAASKALFGDSVQAVRLLATLSGGALVLLTGLLTRELGGDRRAQILAAVLMLIAPVHLAITGFFSMNAFDFLFWIAAYWLVLRIINTGNQKLWLWFGLVVGLGLQNKISMLFFGFSLVLALLCTRQRQQFLSLYFWAGGGLAFLIFLPHIIWQIAYGWPTLEFMAIAKQYKIVALSPLQFFQEQILNFHPFSLPIWLLGLFMLLFSKKLRPYQPAGLIFLFTYLLLTVQHGKAYYLAPAAPILFAAGALSITDFLAQRRFTWALPLLLVVLLLGGAITAPMVIPLLPVDTFIDYQNKLGLAPTAGEHHELGPLPQHYADRFGWESMAVAVSAVYLSLDEESRAKTICLAGNYGEAGCVEYFSDRYPAPPVYSQHNNYFLWGPPPVVPEFVITVGVSLRDLNDTFDTVKPIGMIESPYAMPYEASQVVFLCTGLKVDFWQAWKNGKHFA